MLIDFNALGHLTESSSIGVSTVVGEFAGKPLYMSPEQIAAAPQTAAVDVWAIGALLFEMVAGRSLRQGLTQAEVVQSSVSVDCPDVFDAPRVLHPFLTSCLQADAALRPSASEARTMIEALRASALVTDASPAAKKSHRALSWLRLGIAVFAAMSGAAAVFLVGMFGKQSQIPDPPSPPPPSPLPLSPPPLASPTLWDWFLLADQLSIAIIFFGVTLIAFGFLAARFLRHRASELRVALPYEAMQLISGPDAQKRLSETICVQIDAYRDLAGNAADKMLTLTMVALAKEYKDAETHDQRIATLKMLHELHGKIATRLQPWWLNYETVMARGISLASLAGGVLVVLEGLQRLL